MHRHDEATHTRQKLVGDGKDIGPSQGTHIYGCILLLEGVGDYELDREHPILALIDTGTTISWISSSCFEQLKSSTFPEFRYTKRKGRRKESEPSRINIRYTCDKFGLEHETGTFNIEPNAKFNISIGCAARTTTSNFARRRWKRSEREQHISSTTAETVRQAIDSGTLPRLRRMPYTLEDGQHYISVAELEVALAYFSSSYSSTEQALNSDDLDDSSLSSIISSALQPLRGLAIRSTHESRIDTYEHTCTESTSSFLSQEHSYTDTSAQEARSELSSTTQSLPFGIQDWLGQSIYDEPVSMIADLVPQPINEYSKNPYPFIPCTEISPKLAAARAKAEEATRDYWTWDEERQNYKHYNEGCSEPVWYNPP